MNIKIFWFSLMCMPLAACAVTPALSAAKPHDQFGWMVGGCLALRQANIGRNQIVTIVTPDDRHNTASHGVITGRAVAAAACPPLLPERKDVNTADGNHFYTVRSATTPDTAIVIVGDASTKGLRFASCNTEEGIRFTVSDGASIVWKGYYYLGYDMTPTCAGAGDE